MSHFIKVAVIGHPIAQSKSPVIHNHWIKKYGLNGSYEALDITPDSIVQELRRLAAEGYAGFNLTIPHKTAALNICDEVDALAKKVGAVNTVKVHAGAMHGTNTDVFGFVENIKTTRPNFNFKAGPAVVLGAGGAARAVVEGLIQQGVPEIRILNRTPEKAEAFGQITMDWEERGQALKGANLLVNATSLGMRGQVSLDLNLGMLPKTALVNDIVYAPLMTNLLRDAKARGNPVATGIGMLLHQARPAFQAWFGILPSIDASLERLVLS